MKSMRIAEYLITNHGWYWTLEPTIFSPCLTLQTDYGSIQLREKLCEELGWHEVGLDLIQVWRECRNEGHGSRMIDQVLQACDVLKITITLIPKLPPSMRRDGSQKLHTRQLRAWYRRRGFVPSRRSCAILQYEPKT